MVQRWGALAQCRWRNLALVKDYVGRGVITTATYPARQFGVGSAMGLMKAASCARRRLCAGGLCPGAQAYSRMFKRCHYRALAPVTGGPGRGRGVHRLHPCARRSARKGGGAGAAARSSIFDRHGADLLDRRGPEQAAGQDGQRIKQAARHCHRLAARPAEQNLAAALPQDQRHRPQSRCQACAAGHRQPLGNWPPTPAHKLVQPLWKGHGRLAAPCGPRPG